MMAMASDDTASRHVRSIGWHLLDPRRSASSNLRPVNGDAGRCGKFLFGTAQQEVTAAPAVLLVISLVDDDEAGGCEPPGCSVPPRVIVVAGHVAFDHLAAHRRKAASREAGKGSVD